MALSELYCFANPSSCGLRVSVVGCFIKCIQAAIYAKNLILGLGLCNLNCFVPRRQRSGPAQWEDGLMRTPCYLLRNIRERVVRAVAGSRLSEASRVSLGCLAAGHQNDAWQVWPFHMVDSIPDWPVLHSNHIKFSLFLRKKTHTCHSMAATTCTVSRGAQSVLTLLDRITGLRDSLVP